MKHTSPNYICTRTGKPLFLIGFGPGMKRPLKKTKNRNRFLNSIYQKLGGWKLDIRRENEAYINAISNALKIGYRLLDYSITYENLELVGKAIQASGIPRDEIAITLRVSNHSQFTGNVRKDFFKAIKELGVNYVDLFQIHWPVTNKYIDTWREMIKLRDEGYIRILGVANCHEHHIEALIKATGEVPEVNQIEVHPLFTQKQLLEYCKRKEILVEAYSPIARYDDRLVRLPLLKRLEKKYNKNFVQIILRWHIQNGVIPVVRALSFEHQRSNLEIFDFELEPDDIKAIDAININSRLRYDPDNCDFSIL